MTNDKIARINELAKLSKTRDLTAAEQAERTALRREYISSVVGNLREQLDNTYLVDEKGNKEKLRRRRDR